MFTVYLGLIHIKCDINKSGAPYFFPQYARNLIWNLASIWYLVFSQGTQLSVTQTHMPCIGPAMALPVCKLTNSVFPGAPNDNFQKISVWKTILDLDLISCLPASPMIFEHQKNGITAYF